MSIDKKNLELNKAIEIISKTSAYKNLQLFFDDGTFEEIDAFVKSDSEYAEVITAYGYVNGSPVFAFAQNNDICGGAMSIAQSAKIKKVYDLATKTGTPVVGFYDSMGAKLLQGSEMLASYGAVLNSVSNISGVVPQISVILGKCLGTGALNALNADFVIMCKKASLSLQTNGDNMDGEQALKNGYVQILEDNTKSAIAKTKSLLSYLPINNLSVSPNAQPYGATDVNAQDIENSVFDSDSLFPIFEGFGECVKTAFARIDGNAIGTVITNGSEIDIAGADKLAKFVRFCDAFAIPVITFANSTGFKSLHGARKVSMSYAEATTVKITVVTGEVYGPFYVAVAGFGANADLTLAYTNASIGALAPITGANILWTDKMNVPVSQQSAVIEEFKEIECSVFKAAANGYVEDVIIPSQTRDKLISALNMMAGKRVTRLPKKHNTII